MIRDLRSEIEFLPEIQNELGFSHAHIHTGCLFSGLSSNIIMHYVLIAIKFLIQCPLYAKFTYTWHTTAAYALVCGSANPIRGFINVLSDGNAVSDPLDSSCAIQPCCKIESNSSWLFFFSTTGNRQNSVIEFML